MDPLCQGREEGIASQGRDRSLCTGPPAGAEIKGMERWGGLALGSDNQDGDNL